MSKDYLFTGKTLRCFRMSSQSKHKKQKLIRKWALRQYKRHYRHNRAFAKPGCCNFIIVLDNLKPSYNIGKIFRSGDGFGAREIHLIGIDYFEVKSAKGSFKWVPAYFHDSFASCYENLASRDYQLFYLEPENGSPIYSQKLPGKSAFVFGHEEFGVSFTAADYPDIRPLTIPQVGKVQSLNVSVAASVVMYEYFRQQGDSSFE